MVNLSKIKITECPRDAMQGFVPFIPTKLKIEYLNTLLKVGFDTLDFGSFVSARAIPQLKDTAEVVKKLDLSTSNTKLLAIVGNVKGALNAIQFDEISYLGFPFSISQNFMKLNLNSSIENALNTIEEIQNLCLKNNKELIVYISMAFGNPYGENISPNLLTESIQHLQSLGIKSVRIADTLGIGESKEIKNTFIHLQKGFPQLEFGMHLHSTHETYYQKIDAAYQAGCTQFDSVILGLGGCPMAEKKLVGNLETRDLIKYLENNNISHSLNMDNLEKAILLASRVFNLT